MFNIRALLMARQSNIPYTFSYSEVCIRRAQVFHMITAVYTESYVVVADIVLTVVMASVQTVFVGSFASERRSTTDFHRSVKPGRQALEVLRIANLALWGLGTFVFKHPATQRLDNLVSFYRLEQ